MNPAGGRRSRAVPGVVVGAVAAFVFAGAPTAAAGDAWDPGDDTGAGAVELTPTSTFQSHGPHTLDATDTADWVKVSMTAGKWYHFNSVGGAGDNRGDLYSDSSGIGFVKGDNDSGGDYQFSLSYKPPVSQTYFLKVSLGLTETWTGSVNYVEVASDSVSAPMGPTTGAMCGQYTYSAIGFEGEGDNIEYIWDWNGDGVGDDTSPVVASGTLSVFVKSFTGPGDYEIRVRMKDVNNEESNWSEASTVTITEVLENANDANQGQDAGGSFATAMSIPPGSNFPGNMTKGCDSYDYYRFYAAAGDDIDISLTPPADADFNIKLYSPAQVEKATSLNGVGITEDIEFTADSSGNWYLECSANSGSGDYNFSLSGVSNPALLTGLITAPLAVNQGQWFTVDLNVKNVGGQTANNVYATLYVSSGASLVTLESGPVSLGPVSLGVGGNQSFVWTFSAAGTGEVEFTGTTSGTDSLSGNPTSDTDTSRLSVQTPAVLSSAIAVIGSTFKQGQPVVVTLTVSNTGQAGAVVDKASCAVAPAGSATPLTGPVPGGTVYINGGSSQTFTWVFEASATGGINFTATADGKDANDSSPFGQSGSSPAVTVTPATVLRASAWVVPSSVRQGETFNVNFTVTNWGDVTATATSGTMWMDPRGAANVTGAAITAPQDITGHSATTYSWSLRAQSVGVHLLTATVTGTDSVNAVAVTASSSVGVVISPLITVAAAAYPAALRKGDLATVTYTVSNTGSVTATLYAPSLTASDPRFVEVVVPVTTSGIVLGPGLAAQYTVVVRAAGSGSVDLTFSIAGVAGDIAVGSQAVASLLVFRRFTEEITSYPNPVSGDNLTISLDLDAPANEIDVIVFNVARDKIYTGKWRMVDPALADLDISGVLGWAPGLYLVRVRAVLIDGREQRFPTMKVVVRR